MDGRLNNMNTLRESRQIDSQDVKSYLDLRMPTKLNTYNIRNLCGETGTSGFP